MLPAAAVFAIVFFGTVDMYSWPYQEWERTSSEFMWQLALAAPVASAAATYFAGRITAPSRIFAQRSSARAAAAVMRRHLGLLLLGMLTGYLLAFAPLVLVTATQAQHGGPALLSMATGIVGMVAAVVLGYLVGAWSRTAVLAPAAFVGVLGLAVVGTSGLSPLSPVPPGVLTLGEQPSAPLYIYRLLVLVVVTASALQLSHFLLGSTSRRPPVASLPVLGILVLALAVPGLSQPSVSSYRADAPALCRESQGTWFCVHEGHRNQLAEFVDGGAAVVGAYGLVPERGRFVHDRALLGTGRDGVEVIYPSVEPASAVGPLVAVEVASTLAGFEACTRRYGFSPPQPVADFTTYFYDWLLQGGIPPDRDGYNPFRDVPLKDVQNWIEKHDAEIASCDVDLGTLPT